MTQRTPVQVINDAMKELAAAKKLALLRKFEAAEDGLADALDEIAKAIKAINRQERKHM